MDVTPLIPEGRQIIQGYGAEGFRVSGKPFSGAVVVTPLSAAAWDAPADFDALRAEDFAAIAGADIDVLLLGCGARGRFVPPKLRAALKERGINLDAMDTGAACRTYNVLMAEGRRVAAALLPVTL